MMDIKTLEMGLSENMNAILDGKSAGDSVDVTDTFVTQSIINHPKSKNLKKLNSKDEATELLEDVLWTIQESKNISKITDLENKPTRTQIINKIKSNKKNVGVHEQDSINEGLFDFFKRKSPEEPKNTFKIDNPTQEQIKAIMNFYKDITNKLKPDIIKCINNHPKIKGVFYIDSDDWYAKDCIMSGSYQFSIVSYDLWELKNKNMPKGRDLYDNSEFNTEFEAVFRELKNIINSSGYGKYDEDGDVEDGTIYIIVNINKLKDYLNKRKLLNSPIITESTYDKMNNVLEQMLDGKIDEFSGQVLTESIIQSDENIFYNKKAFIDGDINLCFIVGLSGSGMSRMASEMSKDSEDIEKYDLKDIIHNKGTHDAEYYRNKGYLAYSFFSGPGKRFYLKPDEIKHMLNLSEDQYREQLTNAFVDYAVRYANSHKDTKFIIEGVYLHRYINPSRFRDYAVCILGTSIAKSMYNSDKNVKEKLKSTLQYAGDDLKLNKFKDMYKDKQSDDTEDNTGFDDEYEYENSILLSTDLTMHEYAMNLYTENNLYNNINLSLLLEDNNTQSSSSGTNQQSSTTTSQSPVNNNDRVQSPAPQVDPTKIKQQDENKVKKAWDWILSMGTKVVEYIKSLFAKSNQNVENIVAQNLQWIQSNEQIIRDASNWSETITIQFNGDYQEGLNRFQNTATPAFLENDQFKQALDKDNMADAIKAVTSGWQGFNYDANNSNLAQQFENYFLATDRGQFNGNFKQLADKNWNNLVFESIVKSKAVLEKSKNEINTIQQTINAANNNIYKEIRDNNKSQTNMATINAPTGQQSNPESYIDNNGNWISIQELSNTTTTNAHNIYNQNVKNQTMNTNSSSTNAKIQSTEGKQPSANKNTEYSVYMNRANKFNRIISAYAAGKYTAVQKIYSNYIKICKAVVDFHNNKQVAAQQNANNQQNVNQQNATPTATNQNPTT